MTDTDHAVRLRRLRMRSWRRGMKEMDLILGPFADSAMAELPPGLLDDYERLLDENDQDLYLWVTGARTPPDSHADVLGRITEAIAAARPGTI